MRMDTNRLILRDYAETDYAALYEIMSDPETMQHYPSPFDEKRTRARSSFHKLPLFSSYNHDLF